MQKKPIISLDAAVDLRCRAEERLESHRLKKRLENQTQRVETDAQRIIHELHVHQIELEMQNEELREAQAAAEKAANSYTDLYDFSPAGYFTLDREGTMIRTNLSGARLLGLERARLPGRRFGLFVAKTDLPVFNAFFQQVFTTRVKQSCEVTLEGKDQPARVVQIEAALSADGEDCRAVAVDVTELKTAEKRIRQLAQHLETASEDERKRISRELHDDLGQILTALKIDLAVAHNDCTCTNPVKQKLENIQGLLSDSILKIHSLCHRLRPGALDDPGLSDAVTDFAENWQQRNGIECEIEANIPDQNLSDQVKTAVFRIIQKALTNVSRYARASKVAIRLTADNRILRLSIADNGCGMDAAIQQKPASFGLLGIRERVDGLHGTLHIESAPETGTRIEVCLPL